MKHDAGLDVSVKETSVCIVDETGAICREMKVVSHPDDLARVLQDPAWQLDRVGLEAGPMSQWLFSGLAEAGLPAICIETRHAKAFLKAQVNKTDRNDARGIAQMMRVNLFRPVHVKTLTSQQRRALLTARKLLQEKAIAIENDIRGLLRNFGLKVGIVGTVGFDARIRELVDAMPELGEIMKPLLAARQKLRETFMELHRKLLSIVRDDEVCRRLMTIPGVGPVTSLAFTSTIDVPGRCPGALYQLTRRRPGAGTDAKTSPIGREPSRRSRLALRGRHDAIPALRGGAGHVEPGENMVLAESLGDERRQTTWTAESDRRAGASPGGDHAPHVERRDGIPLDKRGLHSDRGLTTAGLSKANRNQKKQTSSARRWSDVLRGTMDEVSSLRLLYRSHHRNQDAQQIGPPHSTDPIMGGPNGRSRREAGTRERRQTPVKRKLESA